MTLWTKCWRYFCKLQTSFGCVWARLRSYEGFDMCTEHRLTNSHTWELSCSSINILAANYGEGAQTLGRTAHMCVCVCFDGEARLPRRPAEQDQHKKLFQKAGKRVEFQGLCGNSMLKPHRSALCWETRPQCLSQQQGEGLLGRAVEGRQRSTQITSSLRPLSGKAPTTHS